jgi:hypothetical protein
MSTLSKHVEGLAEELRAVLLEKLLALHLIAMEFLRLEVLEVPLMRHRESF